MNTETPSPAAAQQPPAQQHPTPPVPTNTARPPLSKREKRGAFWAGAVGFNLLTLGFLLVTVPLVIGAFGAFFAFLFGQVERSGDDLSTGFLAVRGIFASLDFGIIGIVGLVIALVGLVIMVVALFVSRSILRATGAARPWAITWSAFGIAIVAYWLVGWVPALAPQLLSTALNTVGLDGWGNFWTTGLLGLLLAVIVNAVIGWLTWWWMAHAFRSHTARAVTAERTLE